jgi:hypothetical protein
MTPVVDRGDPRLHPGTKETLVIMENLLLFFAYLVENVLNFKKNLK